MSSRTTKGNDNRPVTAKELKDFAGKFSNNVAREIEKVNAGSRSLAICFDVLIEVMDKRRKPLTAKISDEVKALLNSMAKKPDKAPTEEKKEEPNASPPSNEG